MTSGSDRRSVLTGLGALALAGCGPEPSSAASEIRQTPTGIEALDLTGLEVADGGRLGFAVHDTGSGRRLAWRGAERFVYCSTFKAYLAAAGWLRPDRP